MHVRRVWRYQRGNQNPYIEKEQTTQWSKEKVQKDQQRSTKHTYKTEDRVTRTPLKTGSELRCSGGVSSSCSTSDTRRVSLVTHPVISHEWGKDSNWSMYFYWSSCCSIFSLRCNVLFTIVFLVSFEQCIFCSSIYGLLVSLWDFIFSVYIRQF
jgi:hypothetical protein